MLVAGVSYAVSYARSITVLHSPKAPIQLRIGMRKIRTKAVRTKLVFGLLNRYRSNPIESSNLSLPASKTAEQSGKTAPSP
jgi:hypothetical protein